MKCPKCDYLGFETGDRCKNCGYDFSLLASAHGEPQDLSLQLPSGDDDPIDDLWIGRSDSSSGGFTTPDVVLASDGGGVDLSFAVATDAVTPTAQTTRKIPAR